MKALVIVVLGLAPEGHKDVSQGLKVKGYMGCEKRERISTRLVDPVPIDRYGVGSCITASPLKGIKVHARGKRTMVNLSISYDLQEQNPCKGNRGSLRKVKRFASI